MKIILFAVLLLSCIDIYQSADPKAPNLKLGLSYKQMNLAIDYIVAPLLKQTLSNLTMPGPMLLNLTYEGVTVILKNISLLNFKGYIECYRFIYHQFLLELGCHKSLS